MPRNQGRFRKPSFSRATSNVILILTVALTAGCSTSRDLRVVYRDGSGGVIGLPQNTNRWPHFYRGRADRLMAEHFPDDGYLVVREVEVNSGEKLVFEGSSKSGETGTLLLGGVTIPSIKGTRSHGEQSSKKITETHIFYVKNDPASRLESGEFARSNTYTPAAYGGPLSERLLARIEEGGLDAEQHELLASYHGPPRSPTPSTQASTKRVAQDPAKPNVMPSLPMPKPVSVPTLKLD